MIRLRRSRSRTDIHANFYGEKKRTFETDLLINQRRIRRGEIQKHTFNSNRWKPAKEQLFAETGGKCAYCEAPTREVAYGECSLSLYNYENQLNPNFWLKSTAYKRKFSFFTSVFIHAS